MHAIVLGALLVTTQDTSWAGLARVLDTAIAHRAFPGAVVAIGRRDTVLYLHAFGRLDYAHRRPVTTRTVYDLASLTKVVGLTTAMMMLVDQGKLDLDAPAVRYVPAFHDSSITVRALLTHSSGLPAWRPGYQRVRSREEMFALVDAEPLEQPPGTKMVYSDLGALVMTQIVERLVGERLDRFLAHALLRPLGMRETRFRPPRSWRSRIAPTEMDTTWRHRMVRGEVHDENAAAMGGVAGHAGLFGTAPDLVKFAQLMLNDGQAGRRSDGQTVRRSVRLGSRSDRRSVRPSVRLIDSATIALFTRVQQPGFSSRALGWDTPDGQNSAGTKLTAHAFGHTGFTGTSLWIDPDRDLFVILLTNRVHPTRENRQIFEVRRQVTDRAVDAAQAARPPRPRRS